MNFGFDYTVYTFKMHGVFESVPLLMTAARVESPYDFGFCKEIALTLLKKRIIKGLDVQIPPTGQDFYVEILDSEGKSHHDFLIEARYNAKKLLCYIVKKAL